jgi:hypothetical protein
MMPFRMHPGRSLRRGLVLAGAAALALALLPAFPFAADLVAQDASPARQMRHFWHVFAAYGIAWVLVFGWAVAIFRRLGRVEALLAEVAPGAGDEGTPGTGARMTPGTGHGTTPGGADGGASPHPGG